MGFTISKQVSSADWGSVDKTAIRNRLVTGLEQKEAGAERAVREVYAVIKGSSLTDSPSANWWGPHHEVSRDGTVKLNRNGLAAAAGALAGARAKPGLSSAQKKSASRHLLRHYREIKADPPEGLGEALVEMAELTEEEAAEYGVALTERSVIVGKAPRDAEVIEGIHVKLTRNNTFYTEDAIRKALKTWITPYPKPVIKNHDTCQEPIGRIVGATVTQSVLAPEYTTARLYADIRDPDAQQKLQDGRYRTFSIGCTVDSVKCSICGKDILKEEFCGHWKGRSYGNKRCYWIIESIASFDEISVVNVPSDTLSQRITDYVREEGRGKEAMTDTPETLTEAETGGILAQIEALLDEQPAVPEAAEAAETAPTATEEPAAEPVAEEAAEAPAAEQPAEPAPDLQAQVSTLEARVAELEAALAEAQANLKTAQDELTAAEARAAAQAEEQRALKEQADQEAARAEQLAQQNVQLARFAVQAYREHAATLALFAGECASREEAAARFADQRLTALQQYCAEAIQHAPARPEQHVENPTQVPNATEEAKKVWTLAEYERIFTQYLNRKH